MRHYEQEQIFLEQVVREAGNRVLHLAEHGFEVKIKPDGSQVTTADLEVDRILRERLLTQYPEDGWLSEEIPDDRKRLEQTRVWILDPIDGTRCFVDRIPQYVISIALVENGDPVLAAVFNPVTNEMFSAIIGSGCFLNDVEAHVRPAHSSPFSMLAHASHEQMPKIQVIEPEIVTESFGSIAYALALVAAGHVDAVINPGYQNEWDIAAGVLLVQEAGGTVLNNGGQCIRFNQTNTSVLGVYASRPDKTSTVQQLLEILKTS